ncbi:MAG: methyltransferase [Candidatus Marinimicrobia bacterium]|nr:methyltransferase [Candidatus Neomarinimicrobiota bacterium]|tara:strand:+ start:57295 stop:57927 length:633 start_codon:yes stop_codon:yes gene_type:complete
MDNNIINQYCVEHSLKESSILKEIREFTFNNEKIPNMISGPLVVNLLKYFIKSLNAKKILEVGMFTGYSAMGMAESLPADGELHTCELMEQHINTAKGFFKKSKFGDKITIHAGEALDSLENLSANTFDLIFIDADKKNYIKYYNRAMILLKNHGMIILDNMLWSGGVVNPKTDEDIILNELNAIIANDQRNMNVLLPIRDGVMVCFKHE